MFSLLNFRRRANLIAALALSLMVSIYSYGTFISYEPGENGQVVSFLEPTITATVVGNASEADSFVSKSLEKFTSTDRSDRNHKLAVIIPFRERFEELLEFIPHMNQFLSRKDIVHQFFVLNQVDNFRFNRASLMNVGYLLAKNESGTDYIAIHDVDLLPLNPELDYSYPGKGPFHVSSPDLHPSSHYKTYVGGIVLLSNTDFESINGLSNRYWGWGLEDDELYARIQKARLKIHRPFNLTTTTTNTFRHLHGRNRKRDRQRCFNQNKVYRRWDFVSGLSSVSYRLISKKSLSIQGSPVTIFNIQLACNQTVTPWCICP